MTNVQQAATPQQTPSPGPTPIEKQFLVKGSIPYWDQEKGYNSFIQNVNFISYINLFWYYAGLDGSIVTYHDAHEDTSLIEEARKHQVKVHADLANLSDAAGSTWESDRVGNIIKNRTRRAKHIENIIQKLVEMDFDGVIIDYEQLNKNLKSYYSLFIEELATAAHKKDKTVTVVLHAKTGEDTRGQGNGAFQDWTRLAKAADQLQIMAYGEHWDESGPGPIASVPWVTKILEYATRLNMPKEKLFLGIPLYGYDWDVKSKSSASDIVFDEISQILTIPSARNKWDSSAQTPYIEYVKDARAHEVWYEDAQSVEAKIKLAKSFNLAGITFWRLGEEDPQVWNVVSKRRL